MAVALGLIGTLMSQRKAESRVALARERAADPPRACIAACRGTRLTEREHEEQAEQARRQAVDAEWPQRLGLAEVLRQEPHRQERPDEGQYAAGHDLAADARAERP